MTAASPCLQETPGQPNTCGRGVCGRGRWTTWWRTPTWWRGGVRGGAGRGRRGAELAAQCGASHLANMERSWRRIIRGRRCERPVAVGGGLAVVERAGPCPVAAGRLARRRSPRSWPSCWAVHRAPRLPGCLRPVPPGCGRRPESSLPCKDRRLPDSFQSRGSGEGGCRWEMQRWGVALSRLWWRRCIATSGVVRCEGVGRVLVRPAAGVACGGRSPVLWEWCLL